MEQLPTPNFKFSNLFKRGKKDTSKSNKSNISKNSISEDGGASIYDKNYYNHQ